MKKLIAFALAAIVTSAFADKATFPYDVEMTTRIVTNETVTVADAEVELTGTITPATDTVAVLNMSNVTFTAIEAAGWSDFVSDYSGSAAMLAIKADGVNTNWYGYSGSDWVLLNGPAIALESAYDIRIEFDKTAGNKIRYTIGGVVNEWIAQGGSATQLTKVVMKGTGSADAANLSSGARGAYANIGEIVETYSFDYSNVVFTVKVNEGTYGDKLKITVGDKVIEQDFTVGDNTVDFTDEGLIPGSTYDCRIEIVKEGVDPDVKRDNQINLAATADWFGYAGGESLLKASGTNVTIADGKLGPTNEDQPAVITPSSESAANAKSTVEITVDYTDAFAETTSYDNAQSALALTEEGWKCLAGGDWTAIANDNVLTDKGIYATRAEFDYTVNPSKVRFSVKQGTGDWYVMKNNEIEWFALSGAETKLNGTSFVGSGKIAAIAATYSSTDPIPPAIGEGVITLAGSTDVKLKDVDAGDYTISSTAGKKFSMKWSDTDGKYAKIEGGKLKVISGTPANGIGSYDSYALGLDPESATSKPVLDSAQNADGANMTLKVPNVKPNAEVAEISMKVVETAEPAGDSGTEYALENGTATIPLPEGVKYYKVKISIKTK